MNAKQAKLIIAIILFAIGIVLGAGALLYIAIGYLDYIWTTYLTTMKGHMLEVCAVLMAGIILCITGAYIYNK